LPNRLEQLRLVAFDDQKIITTLLEDNLGDLGLAPNGLDRSQAAFDVEQR